MTKNVLFISYDGMSDPLGQSQVIPYLAGLSAIGHRITIVSAEKPKPFAEFSAEIKTQLAEAQILWRPVLFSNAIAGWSALKNYRRLKTEATDVCSKSPTSIVHCRSYIPALIGLYLKKKFGVKVIFDMRGFWADERTEGGLWNLKNPLYRSAYNFFKKKEKQFLLGSDAIVSLTHNAKREILAWEQLQLPAKKIFVIPCCADLSFFSRRNVTDESKTALQKQLGIEQNDLIVSYSGSVGTWYLLDEMLEFFSVLLKKNSHAKFLFITTGTGKQILQQAILHKLPAEKIIVIRAIRKQMPLLLSLSSASIFFIKNSFSKKASSPTKMGEVLGMGIPVICNAGVGDVEDIISKTGAGICLPSLQKEDYEYAIENFNSLLSIPSEKISDAAHQYFSLEDGIEKYNSIYHAL